MTGKAETLLLPRTLALMAPGIDPCVRDSTWFGRGVLPYPEPMNPTLPLPRSLWISVAGVLPAALLFALALPLSELSVL